uniref:DNA polymerase III polC-type n=1 Tax=Zeugodacus cucurbitae TaxID=28588 RepID=A0A0A1WFX1_ZEUCU
MCTFPFFFHIHLNASNNDVDDTRFTLTLEAARLLTLLLLPLPSTLELCRAAKNEGKKYCRLKGPRGLDTNARMHGESEKAKKFFHTTFRPVDGLDNHLHLLLIITKVIFTFYIVRC